jgi:hypothetical protein
MDDAPGRHSFKDRTAGDRCPRRPGQSKNVTHGHSAGAALIQGSDGGRPLPAPPRPETERNPFANRRGGTHAKRPVTKEGSIDAR